MRAPVRGGLAPDGRPRDQPRAYGVGTAGVQSHLRAIPRPKAIHDSRARFDEIVASRDLNYTFDLNEIAFGDYVPEGTLASALQRRVKIPQSA